jgi:hypothetical protein
MVISSQLAARIGRDITGDNFEERRFPSRGTDEGDSIASSYVEGNPTKALARRRTWLYWLNLSWIQSIIPKEGRSKKDPLFVSATYV